MMSLKIQKLLSVSVQLSIEACNIIKQSFNNESVHKFKKGEDDFVTDADFKIQSMLIKGFKMHFPQLKIIGQQTQQYPGPIEFNYSTISQNFFPKQIRSQIKGQANISQSCLWIDPIDCTKGFIQGNIQDVTVLIGMSTNNSPQVGLIGIPFKKINSQRIYDPEILIGSIQDKKAYSFYRNKWSALNKSAHQEKSPLVVTISNSRTNNLQQKYLEHMKAQKILAGGSGRKIALVIKGQADMMAYVGSATHKWDSCAGEAVVKSLGGCFTTPSGKSINYDPKLQTSNRQGIFCSLDEKIHTRSLEFIKQIAK